jgi:hypothetical protein
MLALLLTSIMISATSAQVLLDQPLLEQQALPADQTATSAALPPPSVTAAAASDPEDVFVETTSAVPAAFGASDIVTPEIIAGPLAYDPARQGKSPGGFYRWAENPDVPAAAAAQLGLAQTAFAGKHACSPSPLAN